MTDPDEFRGRRPPAALPMHASLLPAALTSRSAMREEPDQAGGNAGRGDQSFAALFKAHAAPIGRYLARRVGPDIAEDLVAETFLTALGAREAFDPERGTARAWLFGIATNLLRGHYRRETRELLATARMAQRRDLAGDDPHDTVPGRADAAAEVGRLAAAIANLQEGDRDVLLLTSWAGLDSTEVAVALDIPVGTVRSRLYRVRRQLKNHLSVSPPTLQNSSSAVENLNAKGMR